MQDIQNRESIVPKFYSIVVSSKRGVILHTGVYISLDDAYLGAKKELFSLTQHKTDDIVEIDFFEKTEAVTILESLGIREVEKNRPPVPAAKAIPPTKTTRELIRDAKTQKNVIMKNILEKRDMSLLKEAKTILSKSEMKFLEDKLIIK